jgi:geranylgeranyl reductase family protein
MRIFDIAIAGAGPAGCAAAITLARRGYAVALIDKEQFPREKLCGDFVSPINRPILRELGVEQEILARKHEKVRSFRMTSDSGERAEIAFSSSGDGSLYGIGLSRFDFDYTLVQKAVGAGATLLQGRRLRRLKKEFCGWRLAVDDAGGGEELHARLLIGADGRNSWVAHHLGLVRPAMMRGKAAGLQLRLTGSGEVAGAVEIHLFPGGYAGLVGLGDKTVNLCLAIEIDRLPKENKISFLLEHCLPQNPYLKAFLIRSRWTGEERSAYPVYFRPRRCCGDSFLLVGDAARVNEPVTGEGIYFALRSGQLAAATIDRAFAREDFSEAALQPYERECTGAFRRRRGMNALIRFLIYRPALLGPLIRLAARRSRWLDSVVRGICVPEAAR